MKTEGYPDFLEGWTALLDKLAQLFDVPCALIMRVHQDGIEVYARSAGEENPYHANEIAKLNTGLYCERVISAGKLLEVANAPNDRDWHENPDLALGMIAYAGLPLLDPRGNVFGTICVLDRRERSFDEKLIGILEEFKHLIECEMRVHESSKRVEALSDENEMLLKILCHDLASPIQAGRMCVQIAREDPHRLDAALGAVDASLEAIQSLVTRVRELKSRIRLRCTPVNLHHAVKKAVDLLASGIAKKRCKIIQDVDSRFDVIAEENSLSDSVISNLLTNAVKFSHEGSEIRISASESADSVELKITDYGIGVATSTIQEAMAGRQTVPRMGTSGELGTGFGLQIALRMLREYPNAELAIHSRENGPGTDVIVRLQRHHSFATEQPGVP